MPRVFGLHTIHLHSTVQAEDFEKFVIEEYLPALPLSETPGMRIHLLKGDRGERVDKYMLMFEFDSLEMRNRYFPQPGQLSEELKSFVEPLRPLAMRWHAYSLRIKTDYVVLNA